MHDFKQVWFPLGYQEYRHQTYEIKQIERGDSPQKGFAFFPKRKPGRKNSRTKNNDRVYSSALINDFHIDSTQNVKPIQRYLLVK